MTNDLFRDLLDNKIPGHVTPRTVWVTITPELPERHVTPEVDTYTEWFQQMQLSINRAYENLLKAAEGAFRSSLVFGGWTDYGSQRGLEGIERAHFNDAVEKLARTTGWNRKDCAKQLGNIMDAAEAAERIPPVPTRFYLNQRVEADPPADPRARALAAKQQRGTGPQPDTLRNRGRINRYKEKF